MKRAVCILLTLLSITCVIPLAACGSGGIGGKKDEIVGLWTDTTGSYVVENMSFSSSGDISMRFRSSTALDYSGTWEKQGNAYHIVINMGGEESDGTGTIYSMGSSKMLEISFTNGIKLIFERSDK